MTDLVLFDDQLRVRHSDPATAQAAATAIAEVVNLECCRVLDALRDLEGNATAYEVVLRLRSAGIDRQQNCVARRLTDLRDAGLVRDSGRTRPGSSNRQLIVWEVNQP